MSTRAANGRIFAISILTGALAFGGGLPAALAQPAPAGSPAAVQATVPDDSATERETYRQKAGDDLQEWQRKISAFGDKVEVKGTEAGRAARARLDRAWQKTEEEGRKLKTASAEGWAGARHSYENAAHALSETWDKTAADNK
jgi:hypothetical protein